jgi:hypothetical protein
MNDIDKMLTEVVKFRRLSLKFNGKWKKKKPGKKI